MATTANSNSLVGQTWRDTDVRRNTKVRVLATGRMGPNSHKVVIRRLATGKITVVDFDRFQSRFVFVRNARKSAA